MSRSVPQDPETRAELTKLAFLFGVDEPELAFLAALPAPALRTFRDRATDALYAQDRARLELAAQAAALLPVPVAAKIAQVGFGPMLSAALAGLLEPSRAVGISRRLPIAFLAESSIHLDPRRAPDVVAALPAEIVAQVGRTLAERGLHVIAARFVGYLPPASLAQAVAALDDADLLRTAFVLEDKGRLDDLVELTRDRWAALIATARREGVWDRALALARGLSTEHRRALADVAAAGGPP